MNISTLHNVYFLGIGGIGMSALARYFLHIGKNVAGYDLNETRLTKELELEGAIINYIESVSAIPNLYIENKEDSIIIFTPAIPENHPQYCYFKENGFQIVKRAQILGLLAQNNPTIAIAGTHGKTTVSTMIAHILQTSETDCFAFLGGISKNYNTNLLLPKSTDNTNCYLVAEADEYDRSFLQLFPKIAIITSLDADHLDIYGEEANVAQAFNDFVTNIKIDGTLLVNKKVESKILQHVSSKMTYSLQAPADFYCSDIRMEGLNYVVDIHTPDYILKNVRICAKGLLNVENSVAAAAVAFCAGVYPGNIKKALESYEGVNRRFDYQIDTEQLIYIDDYAHHPEEIRAFVGSVRRLYPNKKITGIFQPHLFTRTRDFADEFALSLDLLDRVVLLEIYPAREKEIEGVNSQMLLEKIHIDTKEIVEFNNILSFVENNEFEILLTMGAGNIDKLVSPIKNKLSEKYGIEFK